MYYSTAIFQCFLYSFIFIKKKRWSEKYIKCYIHMCKKYESFPLKVI